MARAGLSVERLVTAAAELADEVGFDQVSVSGLARRVGVRPASIYSHLDGGIALRGAVAARALTEMADRADAAVAGRAGREAVAALAGAYRDYAHQHPGRYAASSSPAAAASETARPAALRHSALGRSVLRAYALPEPQETHAVRLVGSTVRGFVELELSGSFGGSEPPPATTWPLVLDGLDAVLAGWAATQYQL